jgi:hypothetical protein
VKRSQARVVAACVETSATRARLAAAPAAAGDGWDRPHRGRRHGDAEALQVADDPSVAPNAGSRVRVAEPAPRPDHQAAAVRWSVRVRPAPPDQLTVPAQQRRRAHRQACPGAPRQRPRERGGDRSIDRPMLRSPRRRRRIASSCRSTRISSSFDRSDLHSSTTS